MATVANIEVIKRLVVLIAGGKSYSRALLRSILLQLEVKKIHEVADGPAALDAIAVVNPDVMIVDWDLPGLSVQEVVRMGRFLNTNSDLPIIVLSSSGQSTYVAEALKLGAPHFLIWPISPKMLQQRLIGIVKQARKTARAYKRNTQTPAQAPQDAIASASEVSSL